MSDSHGDLPEQAGSPAGQRPSRARGQRTIDSARARSRGELHLAARSVEVLNAVQEAAQRLEGFSVQEVSGDRMVLRQGVSMRSWGSVIELEIAAASAEETVLRAKLRPRVPTTLIDYGKGRAALTALFDEVEGLLGIGGVSP